MERLLDGLRPADTYLGRLVVKDKDRLFFIDAKDISHLSGQENYVEIHTPSGSHLIRDTLNHLESRLDPRKFARVHRSEIANIDSIKELQAWSHGDYVIQPKDGIRLRLSRRYQQNLLQRFK
jgi:two-component system, LytTR family, response regulator